MVLTLDDLDQAADLIVRNREMWKALDTQLRQGGADELARAENGASGNQLEVVGIWWSHHPLPYVRCCFSEKPKLPESPPLPEDPPSAYSRGGPFPRDWLKDKDNAKEYRRQVAARTGAGPFPCFFHTDKARAEERQRQEKATFYCHLLLSESQIPDFLKEKHPSLSKCRGCSATFQAKTPQQLYCCLPCLQGRKLQSRHGLECIRSFPRKVRRLRKLLGDAAGRKIEPTANLIACEESKETIFMQLVVYARRAGHLSPGVEDEAYSRFVATFTPAVGKLSKKRLQGQEVKDVRREIINDTWMQILKNYQVPDNPDGFSRFVHSTIHYFKIPPFHRDVVDDDPSSADTTPLIRTGENKWTNYVISQESFLTPQEVSRKAGVSRSTVYNWINKGISHTRDGRKKILTPKGELEVKQREKERKVSDQRAQDNHVFALAWSIKRGTALSSAETQIKRLRLKGWNSQDIAAFIGREYVEQATRKLA